MGWNQANKDVFILFLILSVDVMSKGQKPQKAWISERNLQRSV